jgi:hypothetical protein
MSLIKPKAKVQEHKMLVEFRGDDEKIMDEQGMTLTYMMIEGSFPPSAQAGERWEITIRKS